MSGRNGDTNIYVVWEAGSYFTAFVMVESPDRVWADGVFLQLTELLDRGRRRMPRLGIPLMPLIFGSVTFILAYTAFTLSTSKVSYSTRRGVGLGVDVFVLVLWLVPVIAWLINRVVPPLEIIGSGEPTRIEETRMMGNRVLRFLLGAAVVAILSALAVRYLAN